MASLEPAGLRAVRRSLISNPDSGGVYVVGYPRLLYLGTIGTY